MSLERASVMLQVGPGAMHISEPLYSSHHQPDARQSDRKMFPIKLLNSAIQLPLTSVFQTTNNKSRLQDAVHHILECIYTHSCNLKYTGIFTVPQKTPTSKYFIFLAFLTARESNL